VTLPAEEIAEIYEKARSLLPAAKSFASRAGIDAFAADEILMEAADKVVEAKQRGTSDIRNLSAYLFTTYKHLLLAWIRARLRERNLPAGEHYDRDEDSTSGGWEFLTDPTDYYKQVERKILVDEIVRRMDEETRFIFSQLLLGFTYAEIVARFREKFDEKIEENVLRSKYSKAVGKLTKELSDD
jgi:DNA-directed RNA polymerase specialized sigma24 family protein